MSFSCRIHPDFRLNHSALPAEKPDGVSEKQARLHKTISIRVAHQNWKINANFGSRYILIRILPLPGMNVSVTISAKIRNTFGKNHAIQIVARTYPGQKKLNSIHGIADRVN